MEFHNAGLSNKFVERDLSMSLKPSTAQSSPRKRNYSNLPVWSDLISILFKIINLKEIIEWTELGKEELLVKMTYL